jgi:hypothetical protein
MRLRMWSAPVRFCIANVCIFVSTYKERKEDDEGSHRAGVSGKEIGEDLGCAEHSDQSPRAFCPCSRGHLLKPADVISSAWHGVLNFPSLPPMQPR